MLSESLKVTSYLNTGPQVEGSVPSPLYDTVIAVHN